MPKKAPQEQDPENGVQAPVAEDRIEEAETAVEQPPKTHTVHSDPGGGRPLSS